METLKKYTNWIIGLLVALVVLNGFKSCNRGRQITRLEKKIELNTQASDSISKVQNDSIVTLNNQIRVLETQIQGYEQNIAIQNEAMNQIANSKKNINVTVKQKK